jgi:hypothetical protein
VITAVLAAVLNLSHYTDASMTVTFREELWLTASPAPEGLARITHFFAGRGWRVEHGRKLEVNPTWRWHFLSAWLDADREPGFRVGEGDVIEGQAPYNWESRWQSWLREWWVSVGPTGHPDLLFHWTVTLLRHLAPGHRPIARGRARTWIVLLGDPAQCIQWDEARDVYRFKPRTAIVIPHLLRGRLRPGPFGGAPIAFASDAELARPRRYAWLRAHAGTHTPAGPFHAPGSAGSYQVIEFVDGGEMNSPHCKVGAFELPELGLESLVTARPLGNRYWVMSPRQVNGLSTVLVTRCVGAFPDAVRHRHRHL